MQRRTFLQAASAGAATALAWDALPAGVAHAASTTRGRTALASPEHALLAPLGEGTMLTSGWRVTEIEAVDRGAITVVLTNAEGAMGRVQVFRRTGRDQAVATTGLLELRLMNGASGAEPTHEGLGVAVMTMAARIRRSERDASTRDARRSAVRALSTHADRIAAHGPDEQGLFEEP